MKLKPFIRNGLLTSGGVLALVLTLAANRLKRRKEIEKSLPRLLVPQSKDQKRKSRPAVNATFFRRFRRLLNILAPTWFCAEVGYTAFVGAMLVVRTLCDVWMISNGTKIERAIITRNNNAFLYYIARYISLMLPISVVNQSLKYGLQEMTLRFRQRLTEHLYAKYMQGFTYYRITQLDRAISNVDQLLTNDVQRFCESVTELYSNLAKPLLDIVVYSTKLSGSHGARAPGAMLSYLLISGIFLTTLRRPLGRLTVKEQQYEGDFRFVNSRVITNAEEIAFYGGNRKELGVLSGAFDRLVSHLRKSMEFRFSMGVVDNIVAKYFATVIGYTVVSRPFLGSGPSMIDAMNASERMESYYKSGRMLVNLASAVGRVVLAGREMTRLAAYTARVHDLLDKVTTMEHVGSSPFLVREDGSSENVADELANAADRTARSAARKAALQKHLTDWRTRCEKRRSLMSKDDPITQVPPTSGGGTVIEKAGSHIEFQHADLVSPDGKLLVHDLSFRVDRGVNVMITGANGTGKSSIFRVISGLWPLHCGTLQKPPAREILFVPQKPYLVIGTLRDNLIYPHSVEQMKAAGVTDDDLGRLLSVVDPAGLILKEWRYDDVRDWRSAFSGGQKQRVAMARLFYNAPSYAILDECTSAVSDEVEDTLYQTCSMLGITLFTVSHRKSLRRHHDFVLSFEGGMHGRWSWDKIDKNDLSTPLTKLNE